MAKGNLLQIEAQAAQEEVSLITVENQLETSYLNISQLLELKTPQGFEVVVPGISIDTNAVISGNIDEIFSIARKNRPEIKSSELKLNASEYDLKIAQGGRSPTSLIKLFFNRLCHTTRKSSLWIQSFTIMGPD